MKDVRSLERLVRQELARGLSRRQVLASLGREHDRDEVVYFLNELPEEAQRKRLQPLNWALCLLILVLTVRKLYLMAGLQLAAMAADRFSPFLMLDLVVPMIHFYILYKLIRYQRQGYLFMAILGTLAFVRPENRIQPELSLYLVITILSFLLLALLFPRGQRLD